MRKEGRELHLPGELPREGHLVRVRVSACEVRCGREAGAVQRDRDPVARERRDHGRLVADAPQSVAATLDVAVRDPR